MTGHGGQWLEDARHGTEARLRGGLQALGQVGLLWADGAQLEVLPIHGDVGHQSLQVQLVEISLRKEQVSAGSSVIGLIPAQSLPCISRMLHHVSRLLRHLHSLPVAS